MGEVDPLMTFGRVLGCLFLCAAASPCLAVDAPRLSDWMGDLSPLIRNKTLLEITVIQTHNSLSSELTTTISDNCQGATAEESAIAHDATILPNGLNPEGVFAQKWAVVQSLDIIDQLNNGVRAIDFRMIWTAPPDKLSSAPHDWYANHRVQSKETALSYLTRIRDWMLQHPAEIVRIDISRHAGDSYPYTPNSALTSFFAKFKTLFGGLLLNHTAHPVTTTPIAVLWQHDERLVVGLADYINMTSGGSDVADRRAASHECGVVPDFNGVTANLNATLGACFMGSGAPQKPAAFTEISLGDDPSTSVYAAAAEVFFSPLKKGFIKKCAEKIGFSALSGKWCPESIQDFNHLQAYYAQFLFEAVSNHSLSMPSTIFMNDFGINGTMRIGRGKGYAIMDVLLLVTVRTACARHNDPGLCDGLEHALLQRKALNPLQVWIDEDQGRQLTPPN